MASGKYSVLNLTTTLKFGAMTRGLREGNVEIDVRSLVCCLLACTDTSSIFMKSFASCKHETILVKVSQFHSLPYQPFSLYL